MTGEGSLNLKWKYGTINGFEGFYIKSGASLTQEPKLGNALKCATLNINVTFTCEPGLPSGFRTQRRGKPVTRPAGYACEVWNIRGFCVLRFDVRAVIPERG